MKLELDQGLREDCLALGEVIAEGALRQVADYTTVSIERATLRMLDGLAGADRDGVPWCNTFLDDAAAVNPSCCAEGIARYLHFGKELAGRKLQEITDARQRRLELRQKCLKNYKSPKTKRYVLTATGDVDVDVTHALAVAEAGGDIVAVIRSTAQSLLDYVPEGETHEGYGGTFATAANMRKVRAALDEWSLANGRYVELSSFCSGLCMPEIAVIAAQEGLDNLVNDGMYGILYRDINPRRTLIDQRFARMVNAHAEIVINTGEDNYPRTADPLECMPSVVASWFINYALAKASGLEDWQIALGLAMEIQPERHASLTLELAHALLLRELWPDCPVKYMPPTRWMDGNLLRTQAVDAMFNLITELTRPGIQTIGVPTEGVHTPHIHDRVYGMQAVNYAARAAFGLQGGLEVRRNGPVAAHARDILKKGHEKLRSVVERGLFAAIESGEFGDVKRPTAEGIGAEGVIKKDPNYWNPVEEELQERLCLQ
jgi:beta-lysine 5,6-aminomutase alpha subunit